MTRAVLKSGEKIEADIVLVGVGARPNTELVAGQLDLLQERPGGIKARAVSSAHSLAAVSAFLPLALPASAWHEGVASASPHEIGKSAYQMPCPRLKVSRVAGCLQVDSHLRTSDPDVYAVGDIAAFPLKRYGNTTRQVPVPHPVLSIPLLSCQAHMSKLRGLQAQACMLLATVWRRWQGMKCKWSLRSFTLTHWRRI